jgi:hypothetical protein
VAIHAQDNTHRWVGFLLGVIGLAMLGALAYAIFNDEPGFSVPRWDGDVLVTQASEKPAIFILATHWETASKRGARFGRSSNSATKLHWDVFAFETETLDRRFVTRVATIRRGARSFGTAGVLGAHDGVIWVLADRLVAIGETDGAILGDVASLEAKEPRLKGNIPADPKRIAFDKGLVITAPDAKRWRITGRDLSINEVDNVIPEVKQTTWLLNDMPPNQGLKKRAIVIDGTWYGLGVQAEIEKFNTAAVWDQDFREPRRYKLWSAPASDRQAVKETPNSAEFLQGGLLTQEFAGEDRILGIAKPYRLLVLHQDRVDTRAKQTLSCIQLDGAACWNAGLGVSNIRNVAPVGKDENTHATIMFAVDYPLDETGAFIDGGANANDVILRVAMTDGAIRRVDFGAMDMAEVKANAVKAKEK